MIVLRMHREQQADSNWNDVHRSGLSNCSELSKSRKSKRQPDNWIRNQRRKQRNSGCDYVNSRGKLIAGKSFGGLPQNCCSKQCYKKFSCEEGTELFRSYWSSGTYDVQSSFIAGCVSQRPVACHKIASDKVSNAGVANRSRHNWQKTFSRQYTLPLADRHVEVCRVVFCAALGVSSSRVNTVLRKQRGNGGMPALDKRGKHDHSKQSIQHDSIEFVQSHIASFSVNESHYTRAYNVHRKYLNSTLTVQKMYDLYVEKCKAFDMQPVKIWAYRHVFNTKFNYSFHPPRKDTCKKCDVYKAQCSFQSGATLTQLRAEHELHMRKAETARKSLNVEKDRVSVSDYEAFTFDLQKVMCLPKLTTNGVYYCRQLSVYNLGIHSMSSDEGIMHVWDESVASRGADEISSCLLKYCNEKADAGVRVISAYSDACGGQNRNYKVLLMWMHICRTTEICEINHSFMVSGHSYLPNDADFGVIERAGNKTTEIFIPEQWCSVIEKCNRKKPVHVVCMQPNMFKSINEISKAVTIRKSQK